MRKRPTDSTSDLATTADGATTTDKASAAVRASTSDRASSSLPGEGEPEGGGAGEGETFRLPESGRVDRGTQGPPVPMGLEHLLALASTSDAFAEALERDPLGTAEASGVELSPSERAILGAVSHHALLSMIARVRPALPEPQRRVFLERAVATVAFLVGAAALPGCDKSGDPPGTSGSGRSSAKKRPELPPATAGGARPDRPNEPAPPTGIRPDRPPRPPAPPRRDAGVSHDTSQEMPQDAPRERPPGRQSGGGVRP